MSSGAPDWISVKFGTSVPTEDVKKRTKAPIASSPTSTQHQCQQRMLKQKQRLPLVHSVKPNQYTTSVPKEDV